ncbi:MAG: DMT family transporter [Chloroflexi bacterium]|nr:DMT family transporter [Chloroflexota bacterium]
MAFTLWNHTLRTLSAMESTVINNTMTVQIAILAVLFLGETLNGRELLGLAAVVSGTLLVQVWGRGRRK